MAEERGRTSRLWYYSPKIGVPHWWNLIGIPLLGSDDNGRKAIMWGTCLTGYVVFAYASCNCEDCIDLRLHIQLTEQHDEEFADEVIAYRIRMRQVQGDRTPRV